MLSLKAACSDSRLLCASSKVRDFSRASVSIAPADYATWNDARAELLSEAKRCAAFPVSPAPATRLYRARCLCDRPLKAQLEMELSPHPI